MEIGVGSLCEFVGLVFAPHYNGMECTVTEYMGYRSAELLNGEIGEGDVFRVVASNGDEGYCFKINLKLKRPPSSNTDEEAFRRFMTHTLMPLAAEQMEEA